ncbi:hypothetical protein EV178_006614, partial [Coemansia sp. RSA 1646]
NYQKRLETERKQGNQLKATLLEKEASIRKEEETLRKCITKEEVSYGGHNANRQEECPRGATTGHAFTPADGARPDSRHGKICTTNGIQEASGV